MPFIKPENMEPQEESPADTMMNKSSAATAIHTPAGCRPTKAIAFFVSSAVFFAALRVFSAAFFSESLAKELHFDEIDSKYVEQSKTMITVFATITAFENATREFVFSTLAGAYGDDWWAKGVQNGIREKAQSRKDSVR